MEINGKEVTLRTYIPAKQGWGLMQIIPKLSTLANGRVPEYDEIVTMLCAIVKEWGFEGDPDDPVAYENLNLFTELLPLFYGVAEALGDLVASRKN
uniref:Tail assembly chaperone n=1 Tax=viral metagenome TaxID=1070528 RepID=A0A6H1ZC25_9ZZZZ